MKTRSTSKSAVPKPAHGTQEWAGHNVNIDNGCPNGCLYCYAAAMAIRFHRKTPKTWEIPETDMKRVNRKFGKKPGRIMFPTSHDIHPDNIEACVVVLKKMLAAGNELLIVAKPHLACIKRLCKELGQYRSQFTFRFTIGSADDAVLRAWEPGAPAFPERLAALRYAFKAGFQTSISCEPMLDDDIDAVIRKVKPFVTDSIWLGKATRLIANTAINYPGDQKVRTMAENLDAMMTDQHVRDLYRRYTDDPVVKWKDSLKKVLGITRPSERGLDI
jgi:DNA repair photolyase